MEIKSNKELSQAVQDAIKKSGITKTHIAKKIGLSRQGLDLMLKKQSFSIDDANKILTLLHLTTVSEIKNL